MFSTRRSNQAFCRDRLGPIHISGVTASFQQFNAMEIAMPETQMGREVMRLNDIEMAAKAVVAFAQMYRHTPGFPICDDLRTERLKNFNEALANLRRTALVWEDNADV